MTDETFAAPALTMSSEPSNRARITGCVLSAMAVLFLAWDTAIKVLMMQPAIAATSKLGFGAHHVMAIGLIELACLVL